MMKPRYSMLIQWSDEDKVYIVTLPEFGGCKTHGRTYEEAAKNGREVLELLMEGPHDNGEPLPQPHKFGPPVQTRKGAGSSRKAGKSN